MTVREHPPQGASLIMEGLTVHYNGRPALEDVWLEVPHGGHVAVVGPNGAGKSTLFKAMVGLLRPSRGRVLLHGRDRIDQTDPVAYVPQREEIDWRFPVTVGDVVMMGRYGRLGAFGRPRDEDRAAVQHALEQLDITSLARRPIGELSGGQQQRVFLARALAQEPHVLLLDEPFTGVDASAKEALLELLERLRGTDVTVMVSTHDMNTAATRFELAALLNVRLVASGAPAEVFTPAHIAEAYGGQALFLDGVVVVDQCCPGHVGDGAAHRHSHEPSGEPRA
jgi:ABC-type Mn2+/Zn2+ transport system ATPase subunit